MYSQGEGGSEFGFEFLVFSGAQSKRPFCNGPHLKVAESESRLAVVHLAGGLRRALLYVPPGG